VQIDSMRAQMKNIDWTFARAAEAQTRHDVMAHIKAFAHVCPTAEGIIHRGATSCFVQDNADLMIIRDASKHILRRQAACLWR
jgi:adenylosuccinate lyase